MREIRDGMVSRSISRLCICTMWSNRSCRTLRVQSRATPAATRLASTFPSHARKEHTIMIPPHSSTSFTSCRGDYLIDNVRQNVGNQQIHDRAEELDAHSPHDSSCQGLHIPQDVLQGRSLPSFACNPFQYKSKSVLRQARRIENFRGWAGGRTGGEGLRFFSLYAPRYCLAASAGFGRQFTKLRALSRLRRRYD